MRYRKDHEYNLKLININKFKRIPPAIFHTLIENGITHSGLTKKNNFVLSYSEDSRYCSFKMLNEKDIREFNISDNIGIGIKYIKSRLTESYGNNWTFISKQTNEGWLSIITIGKSAYENCNH